MKQILFILTAFLFLILGTHAWAQADDPEGVVVAMTGPADEGPEVEIIILEDGTEEIQELLPDSAYAPASSDERYLAMKTDAQQRIDALLEQVRELENKSEEGELQKQIEQIKMDAEIERLTMLKEDAEAREDVDLADELASEIVYLERIDVPAIGDPDEQQDQRTIQ